MCFEIISVNSKYLQNRFCMKKIIIEHFTSFNFFYIDFMKKKKEGENVPLQKKNNVQCSIFTYQIKRRQIYMMLKHLKK